MNPASIMGTSIQVAAFDLRAGDEVTAQEVNAAYEVRSVEPLQGRVRVSDNTGAVHTYDQSDSLNVHRRGS